MTTPMAPPAAMRAQENAGLYPALIMAGIMMRPRAATVAGPEPEMAAKARENRHMTFTEAAELAKEAGVAELWLTHFSPSLVRPDLYIKEARDIFPYTKPGKNRKTRTLVFDKD